MPEQISLILMKSKDICMHESYTERLRQNLIFFLQLLMRHLVQYANIQNWFRGSSPMAAEWNMLQGLDTAPILTKLHGALPKLLQEVMTLSQNLQHASRQVSQSCKNDRNMSDKGYTTSGLGSMPQYLVSWPFKAWHWPSEANYLLSGLQNGKPGRWAFGPFSAFSLYSSAEFQQDYLDGRFCRAQGKTELQCIVCLLCFSLQTMMSTTQNLLWCHMKIT